jgi:hypothetical protein
MSDRGSGQVLATVVFVDVEGSTQLRHRVGDEAGTTSVLSQLDVVRERVQAYSCGPRHSSQAVSGGPAGRGNHDGGRRAERSRARTRVCLLQERVRASVGGRGRERRGDRCDSGDGRVAVLPGCHACQGATCRACPGTGSAPSTWTCAQIRCGLIQAPRQARRFAIWCHPHGMELTPGATARRSGADDLRSRSGAFRVFAECARSAVRYRSAGQLRLGLLQRAARDCRPRTV